MKHEEKAILYSCDNISLFYKQTQIFIRIIKPFNIISGNVKWTKKIKKEEKKKTHMKRGSLIIAPRLGMVAAFWLAGFYCLLLDPGKTIINLIFFLLLLVTQKN